MNLITYGGNLDKKEGVFSCKDNERTYAFLKNDKKGGYSFSAWIKLKKEGEAGICFKTIHKNGIRWFVGYSLVANAKDNTITLYKVSNGDHITSVLGKVKCPFELNTWYEMKVEQEGKNTRLYFNNLKHDDDPYPKFDLELGHFSKGDVGLDFGEDVAEFKDLTLKDFAFEKLDKDSMFQNPIVFGADPDILYHDGTYYLYFTDTTDMSMFQCYTSKDLVHWTGPHVVFDGKDGWGVNEYMSPNLTYKDGWFYMFYASHTAYDERGKRKVGVTYATSKSPLGPFVSKNKVPLNPEVQEIGGMPFQDDNGHTYLTVVRFKGGNECWIMEIELKEGVVSVKKDTQVLMFDAIEDWEKDYANIVEGAVLIKHKGLYYAMYAGSHYKGSYAEGFATAEHPLGPWKKYKYNPILRSHYQTRGVANNVWTRSPSGKELVTFYHQHYSTTEISPRWIRMERMKFVKVDDGPDILVMNGPTITPQKKIE